MMSNKINQRYDGAIEGDDRTINLIKNVIEEKLNTFYEKIS